MTSKQIQSIETDLLALRNIANAVAKKLEGFKSPPAKPRRKQNLEAVIQQRALTKKYKSK